ncbi:MAG: MFS transporter [Gammaproteobacteria bacterium]|nr:MFS transporter [Gammaproteobacteria bacterium]
MIAQELLTKKNFLFSCSIIMSLSFSCWMVLLNNFVVEEAHFTGAEIGILQSLREVPGFLSFTAVFLLLLWKEQTLALISLCLLTTGIALTGFFPFAYGLYATTVLMSIGFHYFEAVNQSLQLQYLSKLEAPKVMGQLISVRSAAALLSYASIWIFFNLFGFDFQIIYLMIGGFSLILVFFIWKLFPVFTEETPQHKKLILRKRYSLFYLLTFFAGARRQIFIVFAAFMMVEKFGYSASDIALLFIANHVLNLYIAPKIGQWIGRVGERKALTVEYIGLIIVFCSYAVVEDATIAALLFIIDHLFFAMAIAIKTYFQKIADQADMASSAGVSFSINHIAAVIIPATFGLLWLYDPALVFYSGALFAFISLILSQGISYKTDLVSSSEQEK